MSRCLRLGCSVFVRLIFWAYQDDKKVHITVERTDPSFHADFIVSSTDQCTFFFITVTNLCLCDQVYFGLVSTMKCPVVFASQSAEHAQFWLGDNASLNLDLSSEEALQLHVVVEKSKSIDYQIFRSSVATDHHMIVSSVLELMVFDAAECSEEQTLSY